MKITESSRVLINKSLLQSIKYSYTLPAFKSLDILCLFNLIESTLTAKTNIKAHIQNIRTKIKNINLQIKI